MLLRTSLAAGNVFKLTHSFIIAVVEILTEVCTAISAGSHITILCQLEAPHHPPVFSSENLT